MSQGKKPTVLLIEADVSLRRLITLGLEHRGMHVVEASSPTTIPPSEMFDLLIVDVDNGIHSDWMLLSGVQAHSSLAGIPTIVLAWESSSPTNATVATMMQTHIACLTKPFDARVLNRSIDQLLALRAQKEAAALAKAEEALLAAYTRQTPPSIWPIITAIGVLIAFIGMMLQIAITLIGIFVIVVGLLWWTLGTKPEQEKIVLG